MLVIWLLLALVLVFCVAAAFLGAPYLPTLNKQVQAALDLAELKKGQTLIELGCGDGRVLIAAAKRGATAVGYELNLILVVIARITTWRYRRQVKVIWANYWNKTWPEADVVFVFLIARYMKKLDKRLKAYQPKPIKLVSFAFKVPNEKELKVKNGVYLYLYK